MGKVFHNRENGWVEWGIYFGYPKCCIDDFCCRGFKKTENQELVHKKTGFIPCPDCAKKILDGEETLESLIKDRICELPFPNDPEW